MTVATHQNPYRIPGPCAVSFSGGRTSGYMLRHIIDAYHGALPPDVVVVFANTGKEREETLRFVHECATRWGVRVRWVEWRNTAEGFEEVGYNSASREGEPFRALISKKGMPPNWQARFCTEFLKVRAITAFLTAHGFVPGAYAEVIGLRYDEGARVFKMLARNEEFNRVCAAPLSSAHVTRAMVLDWWSEQPFNLMLDPGEGNCDLCFLKGRGLRKELIRRRPESAQWWIDMETLKNKDGFFDRRDSYAGLVEEVRQSPDMFDDARFEHDVECGLLCSPDGAA